MGLPAWYLVRPIHRREVCCHYGKRGEKGFIYLFIFFLLKNSKKKKKDVKLIKVKTGILKSAGKESQDFFLFFIFLLRNLKIC